MCDLFVHLLFRPNRHVFQFIINVQYVRTYACMYSLNTKFAIVYQNNTNTKYDNNNNSKRKTFSGTHTFNGIISNQNHKMYEILNSVSDFERIILNLWRIWLFLGKNTVVQNLVVNKMRHTLALFIRYLYFDPLRFNYLFMYYYYIFSVSEISHNVIIVCVTATHLPVQIVYFGVRRCMHCTIDDDICVCVCRCAYPYVG